MELKEVRKEFGQYVKKHGNPLDDNYNYLFQEFGGNLFEIIDKSTQGIIRKNNSTDRMILFDNLIKNIEEPIIKTIEKSLEIGFILGYKQRLFENSFKEPGADQNGTEQPQNEINGKMLNFILSHYQTLEMENASLKEEIKRLNKE